MIPRLSQKIVVTVKPNKNLYIMEQQSLLKSSEYAIIWRNNLVFKIYHYLMPNNNGFICTGSRTATSGSIQEDKIDAKKKKGSLVLIERLFLLKNK